jgi:hypothetical protein
MYNEANSGNHGPKGAVTTANPTAYHSNTTEQVQQFVKTRCLGMAWIPRAGGILF